MGIQFWQGKGYTEKYQFSSRIWPHDRMDSPLPPPHSKLNQEQRFGFSAEALSELAGGFTARTGWLFCSAARRLVGKVKYSETAAVLQMGVGEEL